MSHIPLLVFFVVIAIFVPVTLYIFSRLATIRLENDAALTIMILYIVAATIVIASTLIFLVQS